MNIINNWPYDDELHLYYKPTDWAIEKAVVALPYENMTDVIYWMDYHITRYKQNIWWRYDFPYCIFAFRKQKDYTFFMLRWGS